MNSTGTRATCGGCGTEVHDATATSSGGMLIGRMTTTGPTTFGDGQVVIGEVRHQRPRPEPRQPDQRSRGDHPRGDDRRDRPGRRGGDATDAIVTDGPTVFGANSRAYGPGARAYGPGSRAYGPGARTFDPTTAPADPPTPPTPARDQPHWSGGDDQRYVNIDGRRIPVREYTTGPQTEPGPASAPRSGTVTVDGRTWSWRDLTPAEPGPEPAAAGRPSGEVRNIGATRTYLEDLAKANDDRQTQADQAAGSLDQLGLDSDTVAEARLVVEDLGQIAGKARHTLDVLNTKHRLMEEAVAATPEHAERDYYRH